MRHNLNRISVSVCVAVVGLIGAPQATHAQKNNPSRVNLTFDRFYNYEEMVDAAERLVAAYPELLSLESIGKSSEGRDLLVITINNPKTGSDRNKPAMYIEANVHGNEVQGTEVCLYTVWYLTKSYGVVEKLTKLMDRNAFYVLLSVNPDGRAHWFDAPNTSSSSRSGKKPTDNDYDGLFDEDGYDDLDGDGYITQMWKKHPDGRYRRSVKDPRVFERVGIDEKGEWMRLGSEGIDNDGDGRINEDTPGGYDMNRNWPSGWMPDYIQRGAGEYPFSYPEPAAIGRFILDRPNIAAVQSYHNAGGMILRGPGAEARESFYPRSDRAVYDEIGKVGERILPYYRYMVIWKDLYTVHGGFVNWTAEGLGIFSFTNELWSNAQAYYGKEGDWTRTEQRYKFGDLLQFEQLFRPLKPFNHPTYGEILIGGWNKYASRVPPVFMLEEICHRNFAFTMYHAEQMPRLSFSRVEVKPLDGRVKQVTIQVANAAAIPSISGVSAVKKLGPRDQIALRGDGEVLASGTVQSWFDPTMTLTPRDPERIWVDRGIGQYGKRLFRWLVRGSGTMTVEYKSRKGGTISQTIPLG